MKKIRFVNGKLVAYIHQEDVNTLNRIKNSVNPVIFREDAIITGECDEEGYYRVESQDAVRYIQDLPYIPDYDTLAEMEPSTLSTIVAKAIQNRRRLNEILTNLCDNKKSLSISDRAALANMDGIDHSLAGAIENNVFEASLKTVRFREMAYILDEQSRNYTAAIVKMADLREQEIANESSKKEDRPFILKKLFPSKTAARR